MQKILCQYKINLTLYAKILVMLKKQKRGKDVSLQRTRKGEEMQSLKKKPGIERYFIVLVSLFTAVVIFSILLIQIFFSFTQNAPTVISANNPLLVILLFVFFLALQFGLYKLIEWSSLSTKILQRILLVYSGIFGTAIAIIFFAPPMSDVWSVVNGFVVDNWITIPYTEYYPNNLGLALVYQAIFKVFGRGAWPIMYLVNIASVIGVCWIIPQLTRLLHNEHSERISIQLMFFAFPYFFTVTYLYNDLISLVLMLYAILLLFEFTKEEKSKILMLLVSGISLGLSYILRTNTLIFLIGIGLYLVLRVICDKKFTINHQMSFLPLVIAIILQVSFQITAPKMIPNFTTKYAQPSISWIAMALSDEKTMEGYKYKQPGMFNDFESWAFDKYKKEHSEVTRHDFLLDIEGRKKMYHQFVNARLSNMVRHPYETMRFFSKKEIASWGDSSLAGNRLLMQSYEKQKDVNEKLSKDSVALTQSIQSTALPYYEKNRDALGSPVAQFMVNTNSILNFIERPFLILTLFSTLLLLVKKRFKLDLEKFVLILIFFGGFIFHQFIWETQPRYFLSYVALLLPLSSISISTILHRYNTK